MDNHNLITALVIAGADNADGDGGRLRDDYEPVSDPDPRERNDEWQQHDFFKWYWFNITYPTSLKVDTSTNPSSPVQIYVYVNPNSKVDGVNVGTTALSLGATLGSFADSQMANITEYPNYQEISNNTTTVSGQPAQTIVFQGLVPVQLNTTPTSSTNTTLQVMKTFVVNNNTGYVITYKAVPSDYNTYLAQAQRIMSSFVIT
jgi:hypothetical protein